jgi:hypothetical protein
MPHSTSEPHPVDCAECGREVVPVLDRDISKMERVSGTTYRGHPVFKPVRGNHPIFAHVAKQGKKREPVKLMWVPQAYEKKALRANQGEIAKA